MTSRWDDLEAYLRGPFCHIEGWCSPYLWQVVQPLVELMEQDGDLGPVAEIGVFHGKFFIGLLKSAGVPANNTAFDVFDEQRFNLDDSGVGDEQRLLENLDSCGIARSAVVLRKGDTMALTRGAIDEVARTTGGFSLFSVDGCHMAEHTVNDIRIAMELTRPDGLIFIDDCHNPNWPGVYEGVCRLYLTDTPRFVPLTFVHNKLILCHLSEHGRRFERLRSYLGETFAGTRMKVVRRFGYDCLNVYPDRESEDYLRARGPRGGDGGKTTMDGPGHG